MMSSSKHTYTHTQQSVGCGELTVPSRILAQATGTSTIALLFLDFNSFLFLFLFYSDAQNEK